MAFRDNDLNDLIDNMVSNVTLEPTWAPQPQLVRRTSLGNCAACSQPIYGESVSFAGRVYHPPHFTCATCRKELGSQFHENAGRLLCGTCYNEGVARLCGKCNRPCVDEAVVMLGKHYHRDCVACMKCGNSLTRGQYFESDGKILCPACKQGDHPICCKCSKEISSDIISALGLKWHKDCFGCCQCGKFLADGDFFEHENQPYCKEHYYAKKGIACSKCGKAVTGRGYDALGELWHPECYRCCVCSRDIGTSNGQEVNGKPYCENCFRELYPGVGLKTY